MKIGPIVDKVIQTIKEMEFRPHLSLIISISEHVKTVLKDEKDVFSDIEKAFKSVWNWLKDQKNTAFDIYTLTQPLFEHAAVFKSSKKILSAIYSAISSLYYSVWEIDSYEFTHLSRDNSSKYRSDFFEISDSFIEDTIRYALAAADSSEIEAEWQQKRILYFYQKYKIETSNPLGSYVSREESLGTSNS
jgi:Immunity protein Imm6